MEPERLCPVQANHCTTQLRIGEHINMRFSLPKLRKLTRLDLLVLTVVLFIGIVHLPFPFSSDQSLFVIGARKLSHGGVLYRDFWDLKPPGVYLFYLIGGMVFGFTEVGIHTFELLYMIAFAVSTVLLLEEHFENRSVCSLIPLLTVGLYYAISWSWHLTQVEALVGVPIFLSLCFSIRSSYGHENPSTKLFLSGLTGGVAVSFKLLFLPILIGFWVTCLRAVVIRRERPFRSCLTRFAVPLTAGLLVHFCRSWLILLGTEN